MQRPVELFGGGVSRPGADHAERQDDADGRDRDVARMIGQASERVEAKACNRRTDGLGTRRTSLLHESSNHPLPH